MFENYLSDSAVRAIQSYLFPWLQISHHTTVADTILDEIAEIAGSPGGLMVRKLLFRPDTEKEVIENLILKHPPLEPGKCACQLEGAGEIEIGFDHFLHDLHLYGHSAYCLITSAKIPEGVNPAHPFRGLRHK